MCWLLLLRIFIQIVPKAADKAANKWQIRAQARFRKEAAMYKAWFLCLCDLFRSVSYHGKFILFPCSSHKSGETGFICTRMTGLCFLIDDHQHLVQTGRGFTAL